MAKHRHLRRRRHRPAGALLLHDRLRARRSSPSPSTRRTARRHVSRACRWSPFDEVAPAIRRRAYKMFVALSYAEDEPAAGGEVHEAKALGYELVSYVSSRCSYPAQHPPGDNCFILEDNTVQPFVTHRQQRHALERQPHRPRLDHRRSLLHQLARRRLRARRRRRVVASSASTRRCATASRSRECTLIGAGALIMKDTTPRSVYRRRARGAASARPATRSTCDAWRG